MPGPAGVKRSIERGQLEQLAMSYGESWRKFIFEHFLVWFGHRTCKTEIFGHRTLENVYNWPPGRF
jgi:hypothetical protein